jgi:signal transduction histidine kinase
VTLRRLFVSVLVTFAVLLSVTVGWLSWNEASGAVEAQLDERAAVVAGAAVETGLQASLVVGLEPGYEDTPVWEGYHARLRHLLRYVDEAYLVAPDNTALVSSFPADSVPIGMALHVLDQFEPELDSARATGTATTRAFPGTDGRLYKWGFAELDDSDILLAVLMKADYLAPLAHLRSNLIYGSAIAAVLAALLAALLATRIVEPLERLSRVALRIQRGRMDEPVAIERGQELGRLSRAMERMRKGIQERDEQLRLMLAQVAHEIRNPLGGLELFASAASEAEDPTERDRLIQRVRVEVSGLNGIIDDFLTFARPLAPARAPTDLREPLRAAADLARAEVDRRGGALDVELPEEPLVASVGADHVKRAALNLLRNAAQVARCVRLRAWNQGGEVVISVSDDGPGVRPEIRERIFDPFVTDKEQGAGLGLAIVRKVAEVHGGRVELVPDEETDGGRGAEFRIYFVSLENPPALRVSG